MHTDANVKFLVQERTRVSFILLEAVCFSSTCLTGVPSSVAGKSASPAELNEPSTPHVGRRAGVRMSIDQVVAPYNGSPLRDFGVETGLR